MARKKVFKLTSSISFPSKAEIKKSGADYGAAMKVFSSGALKASVQVEAQLPMYLSRAMASPIWGPFNPKEPYYRKNGDLVGSGTRDLIDLGGLHDSLSIKTQFLQTKVNTRIQYSAPYAAITYYGGVIQPWGNPLANSVMLPARPWVESTLLGTNGVERYDVTRIYQAAITNAWNTES